LSALPSFIKFARLAQKLNAPSIIPKKRRAKSGGKAKSTLFVEFSKFSRLPLSTYLTQFLARKLEKNPKKRTTS
jgi:hypothetical protein